MPLEPTIVNEDDVEWEHDSHGEQFAHRRKALGGAADGETLGCSLYEVPPGCRPFPYHYHTANEEAIYVLNGRGTLRTKDDSLELVEGDYVALPVGESRPDKSSTIPTGRCGTSVSRR